ncbi:HAMP domain-containing histidine kinase [Pseudothauera rhizosphaerae]|uniref:histidine kinase n=2 Tax=Pseudothauera rhizosphaerae TaxID=2565932 RepID=A0A4V3WAX6_9RHOO|nr:HAMP domain-containing histidine kinase [Pseudothauera rhizosphaerae]
MPHPPSAPPPPAHRHGRSQIARLLVLRWLSVAAMAAATLALPPLLGVELPQARMLAVAVVLAGCNLGTLAWLAGRPAPPGPWALFTHLAVDIAGWSVFLYLSGGATNPLISLFLPLVAIGAAILPAFQGWLLAALAVAAYSLLWHVNRPIAFRATADAMHWHLTGMWITFALSALVVVWFVARATAALRRRERELAAAREAQARDEQILALANLAAGAAHKLGTPLGTLRILADELARSAPPGAMREDLELMRAQIEHCKRILGGLTADAGALRAEGGGALPADDWMRTVVDRWQALRPHVPARLTCAESLAGERIVADATLGEALHTLINNAADASPGAVEIEAGLADGALRVEVRDRGPGIAPALQAELGRAPLGAHEDGMGIGLFLAHAALARLGGTLALLPRAGGGTIARLSVPLERIRS